MQRGPTEPTPTSWDQVSSQEHHIPKDGSKDTAETDADLAALNAKLDYGNGHYYPPGSPDVPNTGYSVNDYVGGLWGVYGKKSSLPY